MISEATNPCFWSKIDAVLVINLDHRPERWDEVRSQLAGIVPPGKLHRIPAVSGKEIPGFTKRPWFRGRKRDATWAARGGCTLSHRRAFEMSRENGWDNVLMLEDDVEFTAAFVGVADRLAAHLFDGSREWEFCYLGFTDPLPPYRRVADLGEGIEIYQVFGCSTTHAYLLSASVREWLLERLPTEATVWDWVSQHRVIDRWYKKNIGRHHQVLCVSPSLVNQAVGFSDIVGRVTDYQGSPEHHLAVATDRADLPFFSTRYQFRKVKVSLTQVSDRCRGWVKSLRGL